MHPANKSNTAAAGSLYANSVHYHHQFGTPKPHLSTKLQTYLSPPRGLYHENQKGYLSYSTPHEQSDPLLSPPSMKREDALSNMSMSSMEETSSVMTDQCTNHKKIVGAATITSKQSEDSYSSTPRERRQEVVDGRAKNEFTSRVQSPTREHHHLPPQLQPKKRKTVSDESVLLMRDINKLKADLSNAELKIQVLEEENERLRKHPDSRYDTPTYSSRRSQLPFLPDLPIDTSAPNDMFDHHNYQHHRVMKQHLHFGYLLPSPPNPGTDNELPAEPNHHHQNLSAAPYHSNTTTASFATFNAEEYERQQNDSSIHRESRRDWFLPPKKNSKKISFALSFDAMAKSSSSTRYCCVSNRGRGSRPPLASRWTSR